MPTTSSIAPLIRPFMYVASINSKEGSCFQPFPYIQSLQAGSSDGLRRYHTLIYILYMLFLPFFSPCFLRNSLGDGYISGRVVIVLLTVVCGRDSVAVIAVVAEGCGDGSSTIGSGFRKEGVNLWS